MADIMTFPKTFEEFAKSYGFKDDEEIYTNGAELIPVFRVEQWLEHAQVERTCLAKPWAVESDTGYCDCTECECGEINDVSAKYCNGCGGLIKVVYE